MLLNQQIHGFLERSSWIRKMFEAGMELKKRYGEDNVFDLSLGNPDLPPPPSVQKALEEITKEAGSPYVFGYMPNAGVPSTREKLSRYISREQGVEVASSHVMITCGAAGALNCLFRCILEKGDKVVCIAPYFVEYAFYLSNHGGEPLVVQSREDFSLDIDAIKNSLEPSVRAVIINSPNNPTGQVYTAEELRALGEVMEEFSKATGRRLFLISDEPYRFLSYDGIEIPSVFDCYKDSIVVSSFSKNISLAGERIGYVALNPQMEGAEELMNGLIFANRILGYVNAPIIGQKILERVLGDQVDVSVYERRREIMAQVLKDAGYSFIMPKGGFYFFPRSPIRDEIKFIRILQEERILAVPGSGFGRASHFRLCFSVPEKVIEGSARGFKRAMERI